MSFSLRFAGLLLLWLAMDGIAVPGLLVGALTALFAALLSLRLLPPGGSRPRPVALARLLVYLVWQSVPAGIDVAIRVFSRDMRLRPGLAAVPTFLPPGRRRAGFSMLASLLPGTVAVGPGEEGRILLHCLDLGQDFAGQSAGLEARYRNAAGDLHG